ncbi:MAG: GFA family protein [Parvibaculum sp.]
MVQKAILSTREWIKGQCGCGLVSFEIKHPARWAYHDHSAATRSVTGNAATTYIGSWRKRFRLITGEEQLSDYRDDRMGITRRFCIECGTPITYERDASPHMLNIPRGLFAEGVGREPRYHVRMRERPEWAWDGGKLSDLKGFPGVLYERPRKPKRLDEKRNEKRNEPDDMF